MTDKKPPGALDVKDFGAIPDADAKTKREIVWLGKPPTDAERARADELIDMAEHMVPFVWSDEPAVDDGRDVINAEGRGSCAPGWRRVKQP